MDFALNEDQLELKQSARAWLADRFPLDRDWADAGSVGGQAGDAGQDDRWEELRELGWLDVAEAGLGFVEEALLLEELGYALYPGFFLGHVASLAANGEVATVDPTRPLAAVDSATQTNANVPCQSGTVTCPVTSVNPRRAWRSS